MQNGSKTPYDKGLLSVIVPIEAMSVNSLNSVRHKPSERVVFSTKKENKVLALIDRICSTLNIKIDGSEMTRMEMSNRADDWAVDVEDALTSGGDEILNPAFFDEVENYFKGYELKESKVVNNKEFAKIERFIREEKVSGRKRRETARLLAACEEVRLSADVAELKVYRIKQMNLMDTKLQDKIADAEKSHAKRKMVIAKAAQRANTDCRQQFKRVREFFQSLHDDRNTKLRQQIDRSLKIQSIMHRLAKTDPRVRALEQNTAERIFRKKESDMTELNMVQNLEEASYLEKIVTLLDEVQLAKEQAADNYFQVQIKNLKMQQHNQEQRENEIREMKSKSMIEMAELIAKYVKEEIQDREDDEKTKEMVERYERQKDFDASQAKVLLSVSDLYDTILWSVANGSLGISSSSDSFDSYYDDDDDDDDEEQAKNNRAKQQSEVNANMNDDDLSGVEPNTREHAHTTGGAITDDNASIQSGSTANTTGSPSASLSPVGHIFVKELKRGIRAKERKMEKRHLLERKQDRKVFRIQARILKEQHQAAIEVLLAKCVRERQKMRDAISRRMILVEQNQKSTTLSLQEAIEADVKAMQLAWLAQNRLEEEQKTTFAKAQALISAQVFHEVRNALSSVVAMSEMTSSLQKDPTVNADMLVSSVSEMLDQNKEVVNYSLNMLNNILDVSKIKAGSFETQKGFFDLQELVNRATTMQLVKAQTRGVKMTFTKLPEPQIAYSDEDILVRIITNFISNAVKFTTAGAVQPFVCPLELIDPEKDKTKSKYIRIDTKRKKATTSKKGTKKKKCSKKNLKKAGNDDDPTFAHVKYMAVGVADTGPGLSQSLLDIAEAGLFNSDASKKNSGAKNSGFGLHLAHQLSATLGSEVNLTELETIRKFWNADMESVFNAESSTAPDAPFADTSSDAGSVGSFAGSVYDDIPGEGAVLYITIPVLVDGKKELSMLQSETGPEQALDTPFKKYVFSPRPSPNSTDGCFRILVADDVAMLRKGLTRSVLDIFKEILDCPISVSTACTAEDALRAVTSNSYDMFICDNQFAPPTSLKRFPPEYEQKRFQVDGSGSMQDTRKDVTNFFKNESFTISQGDGSMSGVNALLQLASSIKMNSSVSIPVLVLHSGHQLELPKEDGIIVVRKPLKRNDFVPLFERNASNLIETGMCFEEKRGDSIVVLNHFGAQLFTKQNCIDVDPNESKQNGSAKMARKRPCSVAGEVDDDGGSQQQKKQKSNN